MAAAASVKLSLLSEEELALKDLEEEETERAKEEVERLQRGEMVDADGELMGEYDWQHTDKMSKYDFPLLTKYRNSRTMIGSLFNMIS